MRARRTAERLTMPLFKASANMSVVDTHHSFDRLRLVSSCLSCSSNMSRLLSVGCLGSSHANASNTLLQSMTAWTSKGHVPFSLMRKS